MFLTSTLCLFIQLNIIFSYNENAWYVTLNTYIQKQFISHCYLQLLFRKSDIIVFCFYFWYARCRKIVNDYRNKSNSSNMLSSHVHVILFYHFNLRHTELYSTVLFIIRIFKTSSTLCPFIIEMFEKIFLEMFLLISVRFVSIRMNCLEFLICISSFL